MDLSKFAPTIEYTLYIASTPDRVWEALTSPEWSEQYFSGLAVTLEPRVGGLFMVRNPDSSAHITGEVIEHHPPRRLVVTWDRIFKPQKRSRNRQTLADQLEPPRRMLDALKKMGVKIPGG